MAELKVFKVIRHVDNKYLSAIVRGKARRVYCVGEFVSTHRHLKRQGYLLTAFSNQQDALRFYHSESIDKTCIELWIATAAGEIKPYSDLPHMVELHYLEQALQITPLTCSKWPEGTIMVEMLRLDRKVR